MKIKKKEPKLYPLNRDMKKKWFIEYTGEDGLKKKLYGKMGDYENLSDRLLEADRLISSLIEPYLSPVDEGNQLLKDLQEIFELRNEGWKPKSASAYRTHLDKFAKWYRLNNFPEMNGVMAMKFLKTIGKKNSNTTRNTYRANLKSLFGDLKRFYKHRYPENPFEDVKKLREQRRTKEWFRPKQVKLLMDVISVKDKQLWMGIKFLYYLFDRPAEMRMCRIADINFETKRLRVEASVAKVSRIRFVPIPDNLLDDLRYLQKYPEHYYVFTTRGTPGNFHIGRDTLSKRHRKILRSLGYPIGYSFYSWKNTGAVKMLMDDQMNIRYISKVMGHTSLDMTDTYFQSLGVDDMTERIIFPDLV